MKKIDIFSIGSHYEEIEQEKRNKVSDIYRVNPKGTKNGVYSSLIRFLPPLEDPRQYIIEKRSGEVKNLSTGEKRWVDCPTSIRKESLLQNAFFALYNSGNAQLKEIGQSAFKTNPHYYSLIQVIEDEQHPEMVGNIYVFRYGKTVWEKVDGEMHPKVSRVQKRFPFDIVSGRVFSLHVSTRGDYPNYDSCAFIDQTQPILVNGIPYDPNRMSQEDVAKYLQENSPDLFKYKYQDWSYDLYNFVVQAIRANLKNHKTLADDIIASVPRVFEPSGDGGARESEAAQPDDYTWSMPETPITEKEPDPVEVGIHRESSANFNDYVDNESDDSDDDLSDDDFGGFSI